MTPFLLVIVGLILILLEFYLPGAILGILGGIALLSGVILYASEAVSIWSIVLFIFGCAIAVILLIRFALWRIVHAKGDFSIYSDANQTGFQASHYDEGAIGKEGIVSADLKPGGFIIVDGKHHPAISLSGYIAKGEKVAIISGQEQSLMVIKKNEEEK